MGERVKIPLLPKQSKIKGAGQRQWSRQHGKQIFQTACGVPRTQTRARDVAALILPLNCTIQIFSLNFTHSNFTILMHAQKWTWANLQRFFFFFFFSFLFSFVCFSNPTSPPWSSIGLVPCLVQCVSLFTNQRLGIFFFLSAKKDKIVLKRRETKSENGPKSFFDQLSGACTTQKKVEINSKPTIIPYVMLELQEGFFQSMKDSKCIVAQTRFYCFLKSIKFEVHIQTDSHIFITS